MRVFSGAVVDFAFAKEDRWLAIEDEDDWKLYGVLDGHGGKQAVDRITRELPEMLFGAVRAAGVDERWEHSVSANIVSCFERLENLIFSEIEDDSGACITIVLVPCDADFPALVINLGDCRAVRVTPEGLLSALTKDHHLHTNDAEKQRIHALGYTPVGNRVAGLEPTRTIGDADVKTKVPAGVVSCIPEIYFYELDTDCNTHEPKKGKKKHQSSAPSTLLVLATDGVWGTIDGSAVGMAARRSLFKKAKPSPNASARAVTELARLRGSVDDITTLVLYIEP